MAPKRSVKISTPEKNVPAVKLSGKPRKRVKPLEVPNVTICLPNSLDVLDTEKKVDLNTKIDLANEVATAQLLKRPIEARLPTKPIKSKRRPNKKVCSEFFRTAEVMNNVTTEQSELKPSVSKKTKKPQVKKKLLEQRPPSKKLPPMVKIPPAVVKTCMAKKSMGAKKKTVKTDPGLENSPLIVKKTAPTRKRAADSTKKKPTNKRMKMATDATPDSLNKTVKKPKENAVSNSTVISTPGSQQLARGKRQCVRKKAVKPMTINKSNESSKIQDSSIDSPKGAADMKSPKSVGLKTSKQESVTESTKFEPPTKAPSTPSLNSNKLTGCSKDKAKQVDSRKTSISSVSNLSWTRDISSSSVTCVTVSSNDLVRFDCKIPIVKLTNIDSEVPKYKAHPSDHSSEDSSTDTEQPSDESVSSFTCNSPVKVDSLNLSVSSPYSTQVESQKPETNLDKAVKVIVQALKNIDQEFINWIQHTEYVTSELNKTQDKLLDIFRSENRIMARCHKIQLEINPDINLDTNACDKQIEKDDANKLAVVDGQVVVGGQGDNTANKNKCSLIDRLKNSQTETDKESVKEQQSNRVTNCIETNITDNNQAERHRLRSGRMRNVSVNLENAALKSKTIDSNPNLVESSVVRNTQPVNINRVESSLNECNQKTSTKDSMDESGVIGNGTRTNKSLASNNVAISCIPDKTDVNKDNHDTVKSNHVGSDRFDRNISERHPDLENTENVPQAHFDSNPCKNYQNDTDFLKPSTSGIIGRNSDLYKSSELYHRSDSEEFAEDVPINSFGQNTHDDDDALSLFAESITGIESSRHTSIISTPITKQIEEYVPEPIKNQFISPKNYSYCPSKITEQNKNGIGKPVCEKQNADSTSIYKDSNNIPNVYAYGNSTSDADNQIQEFNEKFDMNIQTEVYKPVLNQPPLLMSQLYPIRPREINTLFKGYCFFNILNKCFSTVYNNPCRYIHHIPSEQDIRSKLAGYNEQHFVKEYVLIRRNDYLMRKYGLCFVRECAFRKLTRILVEMALDFVRKDLQWEALKVEVVELTLLHLNNVDLCVCDDLLKIEVTSNKLLCEVFMEMMTCTQNFSQFKPVFLSLTYFMVDNGRMFQLEVAIGILERVCILPYDELVIKAFIQIMRLTSPEIFLNSLVVHFEKQIRSNSEVWSVYESAKSEIDFEKLARQVLMKRVEVQSVDKPLLLPGSQVMLVQPNQLSSRLENDQHVLRPEFMNDQVLQRSEVRPDQLSIRQEMGECVPLPPSPDTTNLDNLNKIAEGTKPSRITRWGQSTPTKYSFVASPSFTESDEVLHKNWQHRSILKKISFSPRGMTPGRLTRGMRQTRSTSRRPFNQRLVTYRKAGYPPPGADY